MEDHSTSAPGERSARGASPDAPSRPLTPPGAPWNFQRQFTGSSAGTLSLSDFPPGYHKIRVHGSCPNCKHLHRTATIRISLNPLVFNGVRCENCHKRWFGIGGNSSHASFASVETLPREDWNDTPDHTALRDALLVNLRSLSAIGVPTLAVVEESTTPSPLRSVQHHDFLPSLSRTVSSRSAGPPPSSGKGGQDEEKPNIPDTASSEPPQPTALPRQSAPTATGASRTPRRLSLKKRTKNQITAIKAKCEKVARRMRTKLLSNMSSRRDDGGDNIVEPQLSQAAHKEDVLQPETEMATPQDVTTGPMKEHQSPSGTTSPDKGKTKEESPSSGSTTQQETPAGVSVTPSPPLSGTERYRRRSEEIRTIRRMLTERKGCNCGPNCGPECRCRRHGRSPNPFGPYQPQDDTSVSYYSRNGDFDDPVSQLPQHDSTAFDYMGAHFDHLAPMESDNGRSINSLSRFSIGNYTTVSAGSDFSNFSTAVTCVGSERTMTATSAPNGMLRAQSLPRPRSRSPRVASTSPPPPWSPLRIESFPENANDDNTSSSDGRAVYRQSRDSIGDRLRVTYNNFDGAGRGRSRPRDRDEDDGDAVSRHDYAPPPPMVNGHGVRRQSEPTTSH
jgi:hypothetical protein